LHDLSRPEREQFKKVKKLCASCHFLALSYSDEADEVPGPPTATIGVMVRINSMLANRWKLPNRWVQFLLIFFSFNFLSFPFLSRGFHLLSFSFCYSFWFSFPVVLLVLDVDFVSQCWSESWVSSSTALSLIIFSPVSESWCFEGNGLWPLSGVRFVSSTRNWL
jgi:hypothetical protein